MPTENPPTPPATPDPVQLGADWLIGQLTQCQNPQQVAATVQSARAHYGDQMLALILHASGMQLGDAHRTITRACAGWQQAVQFSGRNQQTLMAEVQAYQQPENPPA